VIIKGKFYNGRHAGSRDIRIRLGDDGYLCAVPEGFEAVHVGAVSISVRVGNTPRHISLPSGALIETTDHERLDAWLAAQGMKPGWLHRLEKNLHFAIGALIGVAIIVVGFAFWGIPWLSLKAAYALPPEINQYIGQGTLDTLDKRIFTNSTLVEERRRQLAARFIGIIPRDDAAIRYQLVFRGGGFIGANAFALPDGTIVVTDELVKLARNDEEILAILLHEIGHVLHRHSLRQVLSHSGLLALTTAITGDVSSAGSLVLAMPNILIDSSYSRDFETEADTYALEHGGEHGIASDRFADFMERLERCGMVLAEQSEAEEAGQQAEETDCESEVEAAEGAEPGHYSWFNYLSTHPPSAERIARFRKAK
jgi:Zn-dependent protease with chaperone function